MLYFLQGLTLGFSASVSPGPFLAYLLTQSLRLGARRALPLALVPLLSDGPIVSLVVIVLAQAPAALLRGLQIAGGFFLLYLAWGAWRLARTAPALAVRGEGAQLNLIQGTLMNLLNPNPWLFWSVVGGPLLLEAWRAAPWLPAAFLGGFYLTLIAGTAGFIVLFAAAQRLDPRLVRGLNFISAGALLIFGLIQLYRGVFAA
ncbi:MAG: LysE family transporter [Anaerolineales bacterium]|nr:LysE family transporter [Anaerolineales bacterium]